MQTPTTSGAASAVRTPTYHQRIKAEKRQAAVDAAMAVFLEQGYERASLQQIATRAGVSTATLFKRFPTKADIFEAVVLQFWNFDAERPERQHEEGPRAGLLQIGTECANFMRRPQTIAFYRVFIAEAQQFPELGKTMLRNGKLPYIERVGDYLRAEAEAGTLTVPAPARTAGQFLAMITDQLFWPVLLAPGFEATDADAETAVEEAVITILTRHGSVGAPAAVDAEALDDR